MAHVRYATRGSKDKILEEAHPHVIGGTVEHRDNHILIWDCDMAAVHNGQVDRVFFEDSAPLHLYSSCRHRSLALPLPQARRTQFPQGSAWSLYLGHRRQARARRDRNPRSHWNQTRSARLEGRQVRDGLGGHRLPQKRRRIRRGLGAGSDLLSHARRELPQGSCGIDQPRLLLF